MTHRLAAALVLALLAGGAAAQATVYRCGNTYTTVPCSDGRVVDTSEALTSQRRSEAASVAAGEKRLAASMARDREHAEAAIKPTLAGNLGPAKAVARDPAPASKAKKPPRSRKGLAKNGAEREDFVAVVPKPRK
jgi:hypothetical protein